MADHEPVDGGFGQMELVLEEPRDPPSASYDYQWRRFESWVERSGKSALPASPEDVAEYLLVRSGPGGSPSTLRVIVAAIARKHRDAEMDNPCEHKTVKPVISSLTLAGTGKPRRVCPLQLDGYRAIRERAFMPPARKGRSYGTGLHSSQAWRDRCGDDRPDEGRKAQRQGGVRTDLERH